MKDIFFTNSRVLVLMLWLSMQLEYVVEQLVRIFNRFYAVNSTAEFSFELAGRQFQPVELADNFIKFTVD